jgi:hypothetical protein
MKTALFSFFQTMKLLVVLSLLAASQAAIINFEAAGAIAEDPTLDTCWHNTNIMNKTFAALQPGLFFFLMFIFSAHRLFSFRRYFFLPQQDVLPHGRHLCQRFDTSHSPV